MNTNTGGAECVIVIRADDFAERRFVAAEVFRLRGENEALKAEIEKLKHEIRGLNSELKQRSRETRPGGNRR